MRYATTIGVAVFLAFAPSALANDAYVDQGTGHDASNDCSQSAAPCKTLARGIGQASAGDGAGNCSKAQPTNSISALTF